MKEKKRKYKSQNYYNKWLTRANKAKNSILISEIEEELYPTKENTSEFNKYYFETTEDSTISVKDGYMKYKLYIDCFEPFTLFIYDIIIGVLNYLNPKSVLDDIVEDLIRNLKPIFSTQFNEIKIAWRLGDLSIMYEYPYFNDPSHYFRVSDEKKYKKRLSTLFHESLKEKGWVTKNRRLTLLKNEEKKS